MGFGRIKSFSLPVSIFVITALTFFLLQFQNCSPANFSVQKKKLSSLGTPASSISCATQTVAWEVGGIKCQGSFPASAEGSVRVITDTVLPQTGQASYICNEEGTPVLSTSASATCVEPVVDLTVIGKCGTANNLDPSVTRSSAPSLPAELCEKGAASTLATLTTNTPKWTWSCVGSSGSTPAICSANSSPIITPPTEVAGLCNPDFDGKTIASLPAAFELCSEGATAAIIGSGPWTWSCLGINGGGTVSCHADKIIPTSCHVPANYIWDGACQANNSAVDLLPTSAPLTLANVPSSSATAGSVTLRCDTPGAEPTIVSHSCSALPLWQFDRLELSYAGQSREISLYEGDSTGLPTVTFWEKDLRGGPSQAISVPANEVDWSLSELSKEASYTAFRIDSSGKIETANSGRFIPPGERITVTARLKPTSKVIQDRHWEGLMPYAEVTVFLMNLEDFRISINKSSIFDEYDVLRIDIQFLGADGWQNSYFASKNCTSNSGAMYYHEGTISWRFENDHFSNRPKGSIVSIGCMVQFKGTLEQPVRWHSEPKPTDPAP